jgi:hypothetical protein
MSLQAIFDPMVNAYFKKKYGGGAEDALVNMAHGRLFELKSEKVESVTIDAFSYQPVTLVDFPNAKDISSRAFENCNHLVTARFEKAEFISESAFSSCDSLKNIFFPCVTRIDQKAFFITPLEKVDFPVVTYLGASAFSNCVNLTTVIIRTTSAVCVAELSAFYNTPLLTGEGHIYVPASMFEYYRAGYEPSLEPGFFDVLFRKIEDYPEICG